MNSSKTLTVFTPTFNRAYILHNCYGSLLRQTSKDFVWLIIDDGSSDNTKELVEKWITDSDIDIRYYYQVNQGMHGAHNAAYSLIDTELNVCIDSDDFMPDDAVKKIVDFWKQNGSSKYAGIIGLDYTKAGKLIGTKLPDDQLSTTLTNFYNQGGKGDKKLVYRTDVITKYPAYPIFEGEKYVSLAYKYILVDQDYELLILNKKLCLVDYQLEGSSSSMFKQYWKNPRGFAFIRKVNMRLHPSLKRRYIECIHYVSSSIIIRNNGFLQESPRKFLTFLAIPLGVLLFVYIYYRVVNNKQMKIEV